jgi:hypothetical protein
MILCPEYKPWGSKVVPSHVEADIDTAAPVTPSLTGLYTKTPLKSWYEQNAHSWYNLTISVDKRVNRWIKDSCPLKIWLYIITFIKAC